MPWEMIVVFPAGQLAGHDEGVPHVLPFFSQFEGDEDKKPRFQPRGHAPVYEFSDQAARGRFFQTKDSLDVLQAENRLVVFVERCDELRGLGAEGLQRAVMFQHHIVSSEGTECT